MRIVQIPALTDNYNYLLVHEGRKEAIAIDPSQGKPIQDELLTRGLKLIQIWNTHHHPDHTGGNLELQSTTGAEVVGPGDEVIPGRTRIAQPGESLPLWDTEAQVLSTPGHTLGHISYYVPAQKALFSGDVIFSLGCGRLFEGTPEQAFKTLESLARLPGDTQIYCAHEYSLRNAQFALTYEPGSKALQERYQQILALTGRGEPTVPTTISSELAYNPFLRPHSPEIRRTLNLDRATDLEVFTRLRELRNKF